MNLVKPKVCSEERLLSTVQPIWLRMPLRFYNFLDWQQPLIKIQDWRRILNFLSISIFFFLAQDLFFVVFSFFYQICLVSPGHDCPLRSHPCFLCRAYHFQNFCLCHLFLCLTFFLLRLLVKIVALNQKIRCVIYSIIIGGERMGRKFFELSGIRTTYSFHKIENVMNSRKKNN